MHAFRHKSHADYIIEAEDGVHDPQASDNPTTHDSPLTQWNLNRRCRKTIPGMTLGLCSTNERRHYKVMPSLIGWAQT